MYKDSKTSTYVLTLSKGAGQGDRSAPAKYARKLPGLTSLEMVPPTDCAESER